eukprot:scaffold3933_cov98-Cylindrotheca_fusiformis.AAC.3
MPAQRGFAFRMRAFVDADHASDSMTRRSRTGFLVYLKNSAPIYWLTRAIFSLQDVARNQGSIVNVENDKNQLNDEEDSNGSSIFWEAHR